MENYIIARYLASLAFIYIVNSWKTLLVCPHAMEYGLLWYTLSLQQEHTAYHPHCRTPYVGVVSEERVAPIIETVN